MAKAKNEKAAANDVKKTKKPLKVFIDSDQKGNPKLITTENEKIIVYNGAKEPKPRAAKYDEKLAITGTFEELIKESANYMPPAKAKPKKKAAKKK